MTNIAQRADQHKGDDSRVITAEQLLAQVWPRHLQTTETLELRWINRLTGEIRHKFFQSIPELLQCARTHKDHEVYFGVSTRFGNSGKKHDCYRVQAVWADLDNRRISECLKLQPRPNIIVDSGKGVHAYWLFASPVLVRGEDMRGEDRWSRIEAINRGLCKKLGADIAAIDISRILRIPSTLNHKYDPPRPVRAYALAPKPYKPEYFINHGIYIQKPSAEAEIDVNDGEVITDLPDKIRKQLDTPGGGKHNDPSREDSSVITAMLGAGHRPQDVYATFVASARGKHAAERKVGHFADYVQRTIKKAVVYVSKDGNQKNSEDSDFELAEKLDEGREDEKPLPVVAGKNVPNEFPRSFVDPYFPDHSLSLLFGDPGVSKTLLALWLLARVSKGKEIFGQNVTEPANVLMLSNEDPKGISMARFRAMGGDDNRIHLEEFDGETFALQHSKRLKATIKAYDAKVVVIDSVMSHMGGKTDTYRPNEVSAVLNPIQQVANECRVVIIGLMHMNKQDAGRVIYRVTGSINFVGTARSALFLDFKPDDKNARIMCHVKANYSAHGSSQEFKVVQNKDKVGFVTWVGPSELKAEDLLAKPDSETGGKKAAAAKELLRDLLVDAPMRAIEIYAEAEMRGIKPTTLERAKKSMGVESVRSEDNSCFLWKMRRKRSEKKLASNK